MGAKSVSGIPELRTLMSCCPTCVLFTEIDAWTRDVRLLFVSAFTRVVMLEETFWASAAKGAVNAAIASKRRNIARSRMKGSGKR